MNIQKLAPWNWFKREEEAGPLALPTNRLEDPQTTGHPLVQMHREIDRLFDDFVRGFGVSLPDRSGAFSATNGGWLKPSLDISATDKEYTISVELPGVQKEDVHVEISGDTLTLRGEKKHEKKEEGKDFHSVERSYGSFQRVLALPQDADSEGVSASFKNGVMTITLPRKESPKSETKQIEIQSN